MPVSVFVGTSVDGFIARPDGALDFLPPGGGEPHGYEEFIATVDAIVIGRKTFETVLAMESWPYGDKRVVVLSSRSVDLSKAGGVVEQMGGTPAGNCCEAGRERRSPSLCRRRNHPARLPARRIGPAPRDHARARAHRRRDPALRRPAPRRPATSRSHAALSERTGAERVPGGRLRLALSVHF